MEKINISLIKNPTLKELATCLDSAIEKDPNAFSNTIFGYKKDDALNDVEYGAFLELANYLVKEKKCTKEDLAQVMKLRNETNFDVSLYDKDIGDRLFGNTKEASKYTKQIQEVSLELDEYNQPTLKKTIRDFTKWWNKSTLGKHIQIEPDVIKRQKELSSKLNSLESQLNDYEMSQVLKKIGFSK